jgi:hypothetical protein
VFVVAFPAENFRLWGAICANILEGVIALAGVAAWVRDAALDSRTPSERLDCPRPWAPAKRAASAARLK